MSLWDKVRGSRAAGPTGEPDGSGHGGSPGIAADESEFAPRQDGEYGCASRGLYLRFARPVVTETQADVPGMASGEFAATGRFVVQRAFGRAVTFTVLRAAEDYGSLTVRRTDTALRESAELVYEFQTDQP